MTVEDQSPREALLAAWIAAGWSERDFDVVLRQAAAEPEPVPHSPPLAEPGGRVSAAALKIEPFPKAPKGYVACRVIGRNNTHTHLVALDADGSNGGRPTVCGLTRFDDRDPKTHAVIRRADLPGWGMGDSGVQGTGVTQTKCGACFHGAGRGDGL